MSAWKHFYNLDKLSISWVFLFQIVLIVHFAIRKTFFENYTIKFRWVVYALGIPAAVISIVLLCGGKSWSFWLGGFLFLIFAAIGYWVDYVAQIQFQNPITSSNSVSALVSSFSLVLLVANWASELAFVVCLSRAVCDRDHFEQKISLRGLWPPDTRCMLPPAAG